jgi:nucleotide-binding universal stress UspA family protein
LRNILACVDASAYLAGVCDYAAWMAGQMDASVEVLHVREARMAAPSAEAEGYDDRLVEGEAGDRLAQQGLSAKLHRAGEPLAAAAARLPADVVVMGKRGTASERERRLLGSNVEAMIRATVRPICLTSKVFLPVGHVLVLLDPHLEHRTAVEFIASHPGLNQLDLDLVVARPDHLDAGPKMRWARDLLATSDAEVFPVQAEGLNDAVCRFMADRGADLIVVAREVLLPDPQVKLRHIEEQGLWGWRTPVLVC